MQNWLQVFSFYPFMGICIVAIFHRRMKRKKKKKCKNPRAISHYMTHQIYFKNIACMPQKASIILGFFISLPITIIISKFSYDKSTVLN